MPAWVSDSTTLSEYNTTSYALIASAALGSTSVASICLSPDQSVIYTVDTNSGLVSSFVASTLAPITTTTLTVTVGHLQIYQGPSTRLYVASRADNKIFILNPTTLATVNTFSTTTTPYGMTESPNGAVLYVAQETAGTVAVVETVGFTVVHTITVQANPTNIVLSFTGATAFVTNFTTPSVSVINTATNSVTTNIPAPGGVTFAINLAISPNNTYVYATSGFSTDAWRISTASNTVTDHLTIGANSQGLAVTADAKALWLGEGTQVEIYASPADTLSHTLTGFTGAEPIVTVPNPFIIGNPFATPSTFVFPPLFIPRKGFPKYEQRDYGINFRVIERWANGL